MVTLLTTYVSTLHFIGSWTCPGPVMSPVMSQLCLTLNSDVHIVFGNSRLPPVQIIHQLYHSIIPQTTKLDFPTWINYVARHCVTFCYLQCLVVLCTSQNCSLLLLTAQKGFRPLEWTSSIVSWVYVMCHKPDHVHTWWMRGLTSRDVS